MLISQISRSQFPYRNISQIDILLGSDLILQITLVGIEKICNKFLAQNPIYWWILSGLFTEKINSFRTQVKNISKVYLNNQLKKFWVVEDHNLQQKVRNLLQFHNNRKLTWSLRCANPKRRYLSLDFPHHRVIRPDKITTNVRILFNASKCTSWGKSRNDVLYYTGPTLQPDIKLLILNWRIFKYVFNGDLKKNLQGSFST